MRYLIKLTKLLTLLDALKDRILHCEVIIAPHHSLVLRKYNE